METATTEAQLAIGEAPSLMRRVLSRRTFRMWVSNRPLLIGSVVVMVVIIMALFAPLIATHDPNAIAMKERFQSPSVSHFLGTDSLGRDIFSRIVYGARISLIVGLGAISIAGVIGSPLGIFSGYKGGKVDDVISRVMDAMLTFPTLILAIVLVAVLGPSFRNVILAISIGYIPLFARTARAPAMSETRKDYVAAARAIGAGDFRIAIRHVAINCVAIIITRATINVSYAILAEAGLSFLGLGVPPPTPAWGRMLNEARTYIELYPYMAIFPGLAITLLVLGFNLLGDGLRDAWDPRLRGRGQGS